MSEEIEGRELLAIRARAARSQDGQHQSLRQTEADRHALVCEVYRLRSERDALKAAIERALRDWEALMRWDEDDALEFVHKVRVALDAPSVPEAPGGES